MGAIFLVYWPAQRNGFVWDDTALVGRDPLIRSWRLIPEAFGHFLFLDATPSNFYRPLQRLTFMADYAAWEMMPRGFHLTSIFAHLAAAIALYFLASHAFIAFARKEESETLARAPTIGVPLLIALIWAIHPLHTSAVTYIAGRADPLAAFFGFGALTLGLISLRRGRYERLAILGAAIGFFAALLSKESGVFALLVWLLILALKKVSRLLWIRWAGIAAAILLGYAALRLGAEKIPPPTSKSSSEISSPVLVAQAAAHYAAMFVAPHNLRMERSVIERIPDPSDPSVKKERVPPWLTMAGAILIAALGGWGWWAKSRVPLTSAALLAFAIAYFPVSNLIPLNSTLAEHWLYVPSAFLLIAAGSFLSNFQSRWVTWISLILLLGWGIFLGTQTRKQQAYWLNERTFLTQTIHRGSDTARMRVQLGNLEAKEGHLEKAEAEFRASLKRTANLPFALIGLAGIEIRRANYPAAQKLLETAEHAPFLAAECMILRGTLEFRESQKDPTARFAAAVDLAPRSWSIRKRYLMALDQTGRRKIALRELGALLDREPFRADSWRLMGELLKKEEQPDLAVVAFRRAAALDVHDIESAREASLKTKMPEPPLAPEQ